MRWSKLGATILPAARPAWMRSHAALPFAEPMEGGICRIYFSARDGINRSHTGWVIIDLKEPARVLDISPDPVLSPGALGCFDDSGAMLAWICRRGDRRMLYYIGWNLGVTVPFRNALGLAISRGSEAFKRYSPGPIVDRAPFEPHFVGSCCVLPDGDLWRMWYLACVDWEMRDQKPRHRYHLRYAESTDGIAWQRGGAVAIDFRDSSEYAISRPSVVRDPGCWRMWYSYRGSHYLIGYAESEDGRTWTRHDDRAGIGPSPSGWDSEMIEYPHVFDHGGRRYMLYNGNGYGRTGFGLAVQEEP